MRQLLREVRRAPMRILTSVFALALAVGAMGVFAIPTVSTSSLRDAAERDGVPDVVLTTTDTGDRSVIETISDLDSVVIAEPQVVHTFAVSGSDTSVDVVGVAFDTQTMDLIQLETGRLPTEAGDVVVTPGTASLGDVVALDTVDGSTFVDVVGIGQSSFWNESGMAFADIDDVAAIGGVEGANRIAIRTVADDADTLGAVSESARALLAERDVALTSMPIEIADGKHPVEADIEQISMLIGMLGIVAGLVGLVLLASTTNTLVVERSREVAVMRALGAPDRQVRRRLRRIAMGIAAAAITIGLPLGVAISYVIARMVLQEFVGLTPGFAVSWPVLIGSAVFALIGARVVAARAARRATKKELAEALRDRDGSPFGRRWSELVAARWSAARLTDRLALRNGLRNRGRSAAIALQLSAAVASLMIVASIATTINDFNDAELAPNRWGSSTWVAGPGLDIAADAADGDPRGETAILVEGETEGWQIDALGWEPDTVMVDRAVTAGRWFETSAGTGLNSQLDTVASSFDEIVMSAGFAEHVGVGVGDIVEVELSSGTSTFEVVGLHDNRGRMIYLDRDVLADRLGAPDMANRYMSLDDEPAVELAGVTGSVRFDDLSADDTGRNAVLAVFGATGIVVVSVAGLAVMSGLAVNLHERRHELAAMRAIGARRRDVFGVLATELMLLGIVGVGVGLAGGYFGGRAIARSFEVSNAVEIGFTFADRAIPVVIGVVLLMGVVVTSLMVRRILRQPAAVTLRSAS